MRYCFISLSLFFFFFFHVFPVSNFFASPVFNESVKILLLADITLWYRAREVLAQLEWIFGLLAVHLVHINFPSTVFSL